MENVNVNSKIELEFTINTSPSILFNRLSTPSGLSEWFADDVNVDNDIFTFIWDKAENKAQLISKKENKYIRFSWLNDDGSFDPDCYFEFRISQHELTGELALNIIEQLNDDDTEDAESLWNYQVGELKRQLGL
ncbi:MAG TPA: START-like domain-containing protein [Tenuifilaceae bacterium]|nr:START-like domain-containing protein [Tenuifilaceae bacterium]HPE19506.1 START-like domain-containing protein [Tenuifilaceae bacterium]HPJ46808.1 START-like domain-containing protein [Tenuifilaceae bacterium]HPQ35278.1 START-like domain-containing protein [Tenuifilaceae bacterium]HRX69030.1 START-like domain-containing protein [Tenuifilaceae bacterium]